MPACASRRYILTGRLKLNAFGQIAIEAVDKIRSGDYCLPGDFGVFRSGVLNAQGTSFTATSTTTTPIILQGKEWADANGGELGAELNWYRGSFESGRKEIANSYGLVRADDLTVPPTTVIYQEGGQAVSPIYRWTSDGLVGAFDATANGLNLASNSAKFSIGRYNVVGFPQLGFKAIAGTAVPDGSSINASTITATDRNIQALAKHVKALGDAMLAHGLTRFTDVLPPVNTVAPVVTGLPADTEVLTTTNGAWTNTPTGYTYQWYRDGVARSGETASTYTQVSGDVGKTMTCVVTASNTGGGGTATSNGIKTGAPYNTVAPAITSDDLKIGTTLTCSTGTWATPPGSATPTNGIAISSRSPAPRPIPASSPSTTMAASCGAGSPPPMPTAWSRQTRTRSGLSRPAGRCGTLTASFRGLMRTICRTRGCLLDRCHRWRHSRAGHGGEPACQELDFV